MNGLLQSRKFWLTVVAIVGTVAMTVAKELSVKDAIMAIQIQLVALVGAIAIEDHGHGIKNVAATGNVTVNEAPTEVTKKLPVPLDLRLTDLKTPREGKGTVE